MMGRDACFLAAASSVSVFMHAFFPLSFQCGSPFFSFFVIFSMHNKPHIPASPASESCVQFPQVSLASFLPGACVCFSVFFLSVFSSFSSQAVVTTTMSLSQWQPQCDGHNHDR
ncbi:hypothetical protein F5148DRAFT_1220213, partial [Russula earlei]